MPMTGEPAAEVGERRYDCFRDEAVVPTGALGSFAPDDR